MKTAMLKNVSWVFASKCISMLAFMVTDTLIARLLGKNQYGEWAFFYSVINAAFYFCWFGLNQSSKVFVSKENTLFGQQNVVSTSLICRIIFSAIFTIIFFLICRPLAELLGYPQKYSNLYSLLVVGTVIVLGNSLIEFSKQLSTGMADFKNFFIYSVLEFFLIMFFVCVFLYKNRNVISAAEGYAAGYAAAACIALFFIIRKHGMPHTDFHLMVRIFKYALPLVLLNIGGLLMVEMDTFMLGVISTNDQVAIYSIAKSLTSKASQINYSITCGTIQDFSVITKANCSQKKNSFKHIAKINFIITSFICLAFIIFSPFAIKIIYGREYTDAAYVIWTLIPYYFCLSISNLYSNFLDFQEKAKQRLWCYIATIVINLILNYLLIPQYGAYGAAAASGAALVPYTILLIALSNKVFKQISITSESY